LKLHPIISSIEEAAKHLTTTFCRKTKVSFVAKIAFATTIWHTWQERNMRIFQTQEMNKIVIFKKLYEVIHLLIQNCQWKSSRDGNELEILSNWGL